MKRLLRERRVEASAADFIKAGTFPTPNVVSYSRATSSANPYWPSNTANIQRRANVRSDGSVDRSHCTVRMYLASTQAGLARVEALIRFRSVSVLNPVSQSRVS